MTLPRGWRETAPRSNRPGSWRFQVRSPKRFRTDTLRTVPLEGIDGVKLIAGKLRPGDRELARHGADSMVPQAVLFTKTEWPEFRDALQWQRDHFTSMENPPRYNPRGRAGKLMVQGWLALSYRDRAARALDQTHAVGERGPKTLQVRNRLAAWLDKWAHGYTRPYRGLVGDLTHLEGVAILAGTRLLGNPNPPKGSLPQIERAYNEGYNNGRIDKSIGHRSEYAWVEESNYTLEHSDPGVRWRTAYTMGYRDGWTGAARRREFGSTRDNPPPPQRLEAFRVAAEAAIARLVTTETELQTLMVQALELADRGAQIPEWIRTRARGLQLEKMARLEDVKTAVARHGAAIEEFATPRSRRANPARARADAVRMFKQFHGGRPPTGYRYQRVPDLSQLVTLGRVVSIDYQLEPHVARGKRNAPYRHAFDRGSTLLTDPTGRALVIVGNVKVSRSPRGRFGYIRAASEV